MNAPKTDLTAPIIHLNGSSGSELLAVHRAASAAVMEAISMLHYTSPHGRDYYVSKDPFAYSKAAAEYNERMHKLHSVVDELNQLGRMIQDQLDARERR